MDFKTFEEIEEQKAKLHLEEQLFLKKSLESNDVDSIMKARKFLENRGNQNHENGKAIMVDPFHRNVNHGYLQKQNSISFGMLRAMSETPVPQAIITTRKSQISEFCVPQADKYENGFLIRKKKRHFIDEDQNKISKKEQEEIHLLTEFLLRCSEDDFNFDGDDLTKFVEKLTDDCLAFDQGTFEIVRGRKQSLDNVVEFYAIDGGTIRIADPNREAKEINGQKPKYVQIIDQQIREEFYSWELGFCTRNQKTNIKSGGYGKGELEILINTVTDLLNASMYNSNYFRIGSNPKGILRVKNMNTTRIEQFRQEWLADMVGVKNSHKMPIIDADTLDFINTQQSNKDMEYHKYMEFLIKIACAIFKISPEEIGFPLEGTGHGNLGGGDNKTELEYSKSKGLKPLLRSIQTWINKYIVGPKTNYKYEFVFVGFNQKTEREELEDDIKKVQHGGISQQDFFIKYSNREPDFDEDIILNPIYLQYKQIMMMGDAESNQYIDETEEEDDNPFMQKAVTFIDKELNNN